MDGAQTITWSGQVPAENAIAIRYRLGVVAEYDDFTWVSVNAETSGDIVEMNRDAEAKILINPHRLRLPFLATPPSFERY